MTVLSASSCFAHPPRSDVWNVLDCIVSVRCTLETQAHRAHVLREACDNGLDVTFERDSRYRLLVVKLFHLVNHMTCPGLDDLAQHRVCTLIIYDSAMVVPPEVGFFNQFRNNHRSNKTYLRVQAALGLISIA